MNLFERGTRFGQLYDSLKEIEPWTSVDRIKHIDTKSFVTDFARSSRPFIAPIPHKHQKDPLISLLKTFGEKTIKVRLGDYASPENYAPSKRQLEDITLKKYIENLANRSHTTLPPYAGNFTLSAEFLTELGAPIPSFYRSDVFETPTVWLGAKGCITPLHRDSSDNFIYQLWGEKKWTIFPPQDAPYLYMNHVKESVGGDFATSSIDLRQPDLNTFPLFAHTRPISFIIRAGEMLYIPMGWAHFVETTANSFMVNYWLSVQPNGIAALDDIV